MLLPTFVLVSLCTCARMSLKHMYAEVKFLRCGGTVSPSLYIANCSSKQVYQRILSAGVAIFTFSKFLLN